MPKGKVKFFNKVKGFGFIAQLKGNDIFVHYTGIKTKGTELEEGMIVNYDIIEGKRGQQAVNVVGA